MSRMGMMIPTDHSQMLALYSSTIYTSPNTVVTISNQYVSTNSILLIFLSFYFYLF